MRVHDAKLKHWKPVALDLTAEPPRVNVEVTVSAVRYVIIGGGLTGGNTHDKRDMQLRWALELSDAPSMPWQLAASSDPSDDIPF